MLDEIYVLGGVAGDGEHVTAVELDRKRATSA